MLKAAGRDGRAEADGGPAGVSRMKPHQPKIKVDDLMDDMKGLLAAFVSALLAGTGAVILWTALWTLAIPWEGRATLTTVVFIMAAVGTGFLTLKAMLL